MEWARGPGPGSAAGWCGRCGGAWRCAAGAGPGRAASLAAPASAAVERALRWLEGMQSRDGGWGAFDADNTRQLCTKLPFCDFGAVIDPPSADVTAHVVEALSAAGLAEGRAARRGVVWLLRAQEPDGSWFGRWGANHVYGTGAVLPGADRGRGEAGETCHPPRGRTGLNHIRTPTAAGVRICAPTMTQASRAGASRPPRRPRGR